jgi:hypothetical protein
VALGSAPAPAARRVIGTRVGQAQQQQDPARFEARLDPPEDLRRKLIAVM